MKIVFVVYRYWPVVGGVEKYVHELAKAMRHLGHDAVVVAGATQSGLPSYETHEGVPIHRFPVHRSPLRMRWWFLRHIRLFHRADVVNVSNTHMLETFWRMVGGLVNPRKVFLTRHGMSYTHPVPPWEKRRAIRSQSLAAGVIHDGEFIERWLGVAPDLCPDQGLSPPARDLPRVPAPAPESAVFVGRLEPDSGIRIYLDGVQTLTESLALPFRLDVYGDGTLAASLRDRAARQGIPVAFHGRVPNAQDRVTDACFAFVDGRMAIQEAMARRRLVVAGYTDPLKRDYVARERFSPFIVPVGSGRELADRVADLIKNDAARSAMVERAFQHAASLTWERTAGAYLRFWRSRLAEPRAALSSMNILAQAMTLNREAGVPKTQWAH